ncbi:NAD(P)H-binding protein [Mycobacterium hodleri]|uniref:NAD(P)H-binding protein n=1 Tax=Mycolicibacterium hodleri TaxID=49897 RepID=UPI0021F379E2|nr:NAD(P)H-binding protein [Mycolicibacterium hodleri]MCV7132344.1 NAD(P)H-binding protein [Mycolicibacterium hodleri]
MTDGPIVVTGATGNVGRPLVALLVDAGVEVRAVTRTPAGAHLPDGVQVTDSVREALRGASAVFLNSRALAADLAQVITDARDAGSVTRLVALSAANADDDVARQPSRFRGDRNKEVEQLAVDSGLAWVSLRPAVFASTSADMWSAQLRAGDVVSGPFACASFAPIVDADISAVAVQAILGGHLDGRRIPLTGPEAFTVAEQVAVIGDALGRALRYQEVDPALVRDRLVAAGAAPEFADAYIALQAAAATQPAVVTRDVEEILGRPATPYARWVDAHRELFSNQPRLTERDQP